MSREISYTAAYIAVKFYGLTLNPKLGKHFQSEIIQFYDRIVRFLPSHLSWNYKALKSLFWRRFFVFNEELLLPGDLMHIICRKYYIQQLVEQAILDGAKQIVVLGSGFDHSAWWFSNRSIPSFEIDAPSMISRKTEFLTGQDMLSNHLFLESIDVNQASVYSILSDHPGFDTTKRTVYIAEGFFDYLTLEATQSVLDQIHLLTPDHSLITTFFSLDELNIFHRTSFTSGVAMAGEAIKLPLNMDGFQRVLAEHRYAEHRVIPYSDMRKALIQPSGISLPVLRGFYVMRYDSTSF
ncbi:MAG: class I SAM-dependent methyltransferase [Bacteroidota bacterium]